MGGIQLSNEELIMAMCRYEAGCPERVQHFLKVYAFCQVIGRQEGIPAPVQQILETAAIVHDIGIRPSLKKYGSSAGAYQQIEGPAEAEKMLEELHYPAQMIERVSYLVGHHHTYQDIQGLDYQILVEADFLVNMFEEHMDAEQIRGVREKIFRTRTGKDLLDQMFLRRVDG
ncbi:MAG TPA: HD domain-containing protein [Candidatus Faecimorpha stercoravium]|nr:HD domain-containing protein [Candidatus Faecimorpha stercoravium]